MSFRPFLREFFGEFMAPDPWNKEEPVLWSLEGYQMLHWRMKVVAPPGTPEVPSKGRLNAQPKTKPGDDRFPGIRSTQYDRYRILPLGVYDLWCEGVLKPADLPWLLHAIESNLHATDYPPAFSKTYLSMMSGIFFFFAIMSVGLYYYITATNAAPAEPRFLWLPGVCAFLGLASIIGLQYVKIRRKTVRQRVLDILAQRKAS